MAHTNIQFISITTLLESYSVSCLAGAIENHGVFVRDNLDRYKEAINDLGKGWFCSVDPLIGSSAIKHRNDEKTASKFTRTRAIVLLEKWHLSPSDRLGSSFCLWLELSRFGWDSADLPPLESAEIGQEQTKISKRDRRIKRILEVIENFGYEPHCIPYGKKREIGDECLKDELLFTEHTFKSAWQAGRDSVPQLWEVENVDKYRQ